MARILLFTRAGELAGVKTCIPPGSMYVYLETSDFNPRAQMVADMITPKQFGYLRAVARDTGADADLECQKHYGCELIDISRSAASRLIDHLKTGTYLPIVKG
jgi:hypothetical protein